jgi:hypothetical protein
VVLNDPSCVLGPTNYYVVQDDPNKRYLFPYTPFVDAGKPIWTAYGYSYATEPFEICACGGTSGEDHEPHEEDKLTRTKHWIERSLAR